MIKEFFSNLHLRFKAWEAGTTVERYVYNKWYYSKVEPYYDNLHDRYHGFKYIIPVDYEHVTSHREPFGWVLIDELQKMQYPHRDFNTCILSAILRVSNDERILPHTLSQHRSHFVMDEFCGYDQAFIMTNDEEEALMITMKYGRTIT